MKTVPTKPGRGNKDVKQSIILFKRADLKPLECRQFHTCKLRTTPADATSPSLRALVTFFRGRKP
eukprot:2907982-Ditylum_brightwellii.AAC.1